MKVNGGNPVSLTAEQHNSLCDENDKMKIDEINFFTLEGIELRIIVLT